MRKSNSNPKSPFTFRVLPDGEPITLTGQRAKAIRVLLQRTATGVTGLEALIECGIGRMSSRVSELRLAVVIETVRERTASGASIGRYWLRSKIEELGGEDNVDA